MTALQTRDLCGGDGRRPQGCGGKDERGWRGWIQIVTGGSHGSNHSIGTSILENANIFLPKSFKEAPM